MVNHMLENKLITDNQFSDPDAAFRLIVEAHRGLSEQESATLNAKLVLILANHIGDMDVLRAALMLAKKR
jgi:Protein of unknown function (DUF2783)